MRILFTLLLSQFIFFYSGAQTEIIDSSTTILVVPFDRFEMHSEFTLEELNRINHLEKDQFYQEMLQNFTVAFETYNGNGLKYKIINNEDWKQFKFKSTYTYIQKEAHFGCDLNAYEVTDYQELLDRYNSSYLVVIPWYKIIEHKEKLKTEDSKRLMGLYSMHLIDYDIFNRNKDRVYYEASKKFSAQVTEENMKYYGLRLQDMIPTYSMLVHEISIELVQKLEH